MLSTAHASRSRLSRVRVLGVAAMVVAATAGIGTAAAPQAAPAGGVDPGTVELTLGPGQSATLAKRVTTPAVAPKPDIVFLADTTGSMDPVLANVRNNTRTIIDQVRAAQPDARFAVSEYKDQVDGDRVFRVNTPLTDDEDAVQNGTNDWLFNVGGGGAPWTDFINAHFRIATDAIAFRPNSTRIIAWFGDAASRDPSLGHTLADANAALRAAGVRVVAVPIVGTSGDGLDRLGQATSITNATRGRLMPNADASQVSQAILDGIHGLDVTVTPQVTSCDAALSVSFDPANRTVQSGTDAAFTETFSVRPDATVGTYHCTVDFLVNGVSEGLVQQTTVHVPGVSIGDVTVTEGDSGTTSATFSVSLDRPATTEVRVHWAASDGTATAPGDYLASSGDAIFPAGTTTQPVTVPIVGDLTAETVESFAVTLSAPLRVAIADGGAVGTIVDNDGVATPRVSVGDVTVIEGDAGTTEAAFTVSLDRAANREVSVRAATADGTATAPGDYAAVTTPVTFAAGEISKSVVVAVVGETAVEPDESFTLNLSEPSGVEIQDGQGAGVIVNDDQTPTPPRLSIGDTAVGEGDGGTVPITFTISLSQTLTTPVTVNWATVNDTAVAPGDFTAASGEELFSPGETSRQVTIQVNGDAEFEGRLESFTVRLSDAVGAEIVDGQGSGWILDDDDPLNPQPDPHVAIGDVTLVEGNDGNARATFTLTLSQPATQIVAVQWETGDGTAAAPGDFTAASGNERFNPGEVSRQVAVDVIGDRAEEADETFSVQLTGASNATISRQAGIGTIVNDDDEVRPALSIGDATVAEGNSGTTQANFTITLSEAPVEPVTVQWNTIDGTATAPGDYLADGDGVTFAPGQTSRQVSVAVVGDLVEESDESFTVNLYNPAGATIADGQGVGTIGNDDRSDPPSMSVDDVTVTEGDTGTAQAIFTISLSHPTPAEVRVDWATADGTATQPGDYLGSGGTETFAPGQTSREVGVSIVGDTVVESDESFTVTLSNAVGASVGDAQGVGTIIDNDEDPIQPRLSIGDTTVTEGNAGTTQATFTIGLDRASTGPVTVHWATANGTATAPDDFTAGSGDDTFEAGQVTRQVTVDVRGDTVDEDDESFTVDLSAAVGAEIVDPQGVGVILDDDGPPSARLSIGDVSVVEGNSGTTQATFTVTRTGGGTEPITVDYATADGTAVAPGDYTATSGQLTFAPDQTSQPIAVPIVGDTLAEGDESFTVTLSNPTNAEIVDAQGVGVILDDGDPGDPEPQLSIGDTTVTEGDTGTTQATFTISLSRAPASGEVSVRWATADGTATAPADYAASGGVETFTAGQLSRQVTVPVVGDTAVEGDETFAVTLSDATNAEILDGQGVGTIVNDDVEQPRLNIGDVSVTEGDTGTTQATFTVTLDRPGAEAVGVRFATADGTATAPGDYVAATGELNFPIGVTSQPVTVDVVGDLVNEPTESFTVVLSDATGAEVADGQGVGTIVDNDPVRNGQFTCTATALNLVNSTANPPNVPCRDDARSTDLVRVNLGLLVIKGTGLTATTDQTPDDLSVAPAAGDNATARAELTSTRISTLGLTIEVGVIGSTATARCVAGPNGLVPQLSGSSTIATLKINGVAIPVGSAPLRIPLVIGSLELNTTVTTGTSVTQRAFALTTLLGGVVIGEAKAGVRGSPCGS